jgi:type II secretory pathway pseudopilin PulG
MNVGHPIRTGLITIAILSAIIVLLTPGGHYGAGAKRDDAQNTLSQLRSAMDAYRIEFGQYPDGTPSEIWAALDGQNARRITFFERDPKSTLAVGQLADPWGLPYKISSVDPNHVILRSAGANTRFEDSPGADDIREK